jgi:hypothetical protein
LGEAPRARKRTSFIKRYPISRPRIGERKRATSTFSRPVILIVVSPKFAPTAPTIPPIRAWDELEGMPKNQVTRFQMMALKRATKITLRVMVAGSTTS